MIYMLKIMISVTLPDTASVYPAGGAGRDLINVLEKIVDLGSHYTAK